MPVRTFYHNISKIHSKIGHNWWIVDESLARATQVNRPDDTFQMEYWKKIIQIGYKLRFQANFVQYHEVCLELICILTYNYWLLPSMAPGFEYQLVFYEPGNHPFSSIYFSHHFCYNRLGYGFLNKNNLSQITSPVSRSKGNLDFNFPKLHRISFKRRYIPKFI